MCLFVWMKWKFMIKLTQIMVIKIREVKIRLVNILSILYWFTGIRIHWRSVSARWLLHSCEIRHGQNSTSKGVCKENIIIPLVVWTWIRVIPNFKFIHLDKYMKVGKKIKIQRCHLLTTSKSSLQIFIDFVCVIFILCTCSLRWMLIVLESPSVNPNWESNPRYVNTTGLEIGHFSLSSKKSSLLHVFKKCQN